MNLLFLIVGLALVWGVLSGLAVFVIFSGKGGAS